MVEEKNTIVFAPFVDRPEQNLFEKYGREGAYVVVTGGNSGIGKELCTQMARQGFNICIIGRNKEKIKASIPEIVKDSGKTPEVKVVIADFSKMSKMSEYSTLAEELKDIDIAMLDLNAGVLEMGDFSAMSDASLEAMMNCNALHPIYLTKALMNQMLARDLKSAIIIMSSVAGCYEHPGAAAYCASKAITNFFGRSLSHEVKEKIDVMTYAPAMTSTPMMPLDVGAMGGAVVSVEESVTGALKDLGHTNFTHGCKKHQDFHDANHASCVDVAGRYAAQKSAGSMVSNEK